MKLEAPAPPLRAPAQVLNGRTLVTGLVVQLVVGRFRHPQIDLCGALTGLERRSSATRGSDIANLDSATRVKFNNFRRRERQEPLSTCVWGPSQSLEPNAAETARLLHARVGSE